MSLHQADGRTYLARSDEDYDLIWYVAPDSYAANNAASSGAFVLSESYLYTKEMIADSLEHLTDDGHHGRPVRRARLHATRRTAPRRYVDDGARRDGGASAIENPGDHMIVSAFITNETGDLSTIILKRTPFTPAEVDALRRSGAEDPAGRRTAWAPGEPTGDHLVVPARRRDDRRRGRRDRRRLPPRHQRRSPTTRRSSGTSAASTT